MTSIFIILVVTTIIGLLSNIIASWLQPTLQNRKRVTIFIFITLSIFCAFFTINTNNTNGGNQKTNLGDTSKRYDTVIRFVKYVPDSSAIVNYLRGDTVKKVLLPAILETDTVNNRKTDTTITDRAGNIYTFFKSGSLLWLTENLNTNIIDSYVYDDNQSSATYSGRLYTWRAASTACKMLGEGWRLPTSEEFDRLVSEHNGGFSTVYGGGMPGLESGSEIGNSANGFKNFIDGPNSKFHLVFGGFGSKVPLMDRRYHSLYKSAYYWALDEKQDSRFYYLFDSEVKKIFKFQYFYHPTYTINASCRCVKSL